MNFGQGATCCACTVLISTLTAGAADAKGSSVDIAPLRLTAVIVNDPDFPPIDTEFAKKALSIAATGLEGRFGIAAPRFELAGELSVANFLGKYTLPSDPRCKPMYDARYRGGGAEELAPHRATALTFLKRWPLDSLLGFVDPDARPSIESHEDVYQSYVTKYVAAVERMRALKTPAGTPLIEPERSQLRSFVAWTCALLRQNDFDIVLTNTFILADLLTEPHPHAVFGKAKIGGIAGRSPARSALGGQALLASTFGIDTKLAELAELPGSPATPEERVKILGLYLIAHEIAHAVFGIPDVFDHPTGCIMTSRPGSNYRDGLAELEAHPEPCPRCWPYVEAKAALDRGERQLGEGAYRAALASANRAANLMPSHFHGGRKRRMATALSIASRALRELGKEEKARSYAEAARELDPSSDDVMRLFEPGTTASALREVGATTTATAASLAR